ncbi:hypothetical protein KGF56_000149 [Candida oxycetoniae]|uniref:Phospholipid/glycerol acyltransferase domain-containing protein n=1 Tax=Candida oxycetoniae TaxID=497107 RepID=A0AAI9X039_9ASCO|nr:uncharacterized protein KGF56_000149 [Candida oxycetoniae]KAI3407061.2 hypothetical protein KGF56_000149 [Candida oxycetoniae]
MEKFSAWRDRATGISPFMPQKVPNKQTSFNKYLFSLVRVPIFILKLPFFAICGLLYSITGFNFLLNFIFTFLLAFNPIEYSVDGVKKSQTFQLQQYKPQKSDLIIANYISPLDGYIMALLCHSNSNMVIVAPDKQGKLYKYNPWTLMKFCFSKQAHGDGVPVDDLCKYHDKIVFLLLEGTTSNNTALLPFIKLDSKYQIDQFEIKALVMKLYPQFFTLPIANYTPLYYLFQLLTDFGKKNVKCKIYKFDGKQTDEKLNLNQVRKAFELNSLNSVHGDLSIEAKQKFITYYTNYEVKK